MTRALRLILSPEIDTSVSSDEGHAMVIGELVPGFLIARTYSVTSLHQRTSILRRFVDDIGNIRPAAITADHIIGWWSGLADKASATKQAHLSAVRQFLEHVRAMGYAVIDVGGIIKRPRAPRKPPVVLTEAEILRFLAWLPTARDRAMGALMLGCGLRASDVAGIQIEQVDLDGRLVTVLGKGGKTRLVPIPVATVVCVQAYLQHRPATVGPLLRAFRRDTQLNPQHVQQRMTKLLWASGIKRAAWDGRSSHVLRRTCATTLLMSGATVRDVQEILGHESLATTHAYLAVPEARRLVALIDNGPMPTLGPAA